MEKKKKTESKQKSLNWIYKKIKFQTLFLVKCLFVKKARIQMKKLWCLTLTNTLKSSIYIYVF
jgi:hypothetical protein